MLEITAVWENKDDNPLTCISAIKLNELHLKKLKQLAYVMILGCVEGRIMVSSKDVHMQCLKSVNVLLYLTERTLLVWLNILRWEDYLVIRVGQVQSQGFLKEGGRKAREGINDVIMDAKGSDVMAGSWLWAIECGWPLKAGRVKEWVLPSDTSERMQSSQYLDFKPGTLISDFWTPDYNKPVWF